MYDNWEINDNIFIEKDDDMRDYTEINDEYSKQLDEFYQNIGR